MVTLAKHLLTGLLVSVTPGLLVSGTLAGPGGGQAIRNEKLGFVISLPSDLDWERCAPEARCQAHFTTFDKTAQPPWVVDVRLFVLPATPRRSLQEEAEALRPTFENAALARARRKVTAGKLDGEPCLLVDVAGDRIHVTWRIARRDSRLYVLHACRTDGAIGDKSVEKEIDRVVGTFRFLRRETPPPPGPAPPGTAPPAPEAPVPRKEYRLAHWRLECVKPAGLREVPPEDLDKQNGVILRFEGHAEQSRCLIRIYAHRRSAARRVPLERLARKKIERFEKNHPKRMDPVTAKWKLPLATKALRLELTALRSTPEVTRWYLADCRNERRYEIEVITTGQAWESHVAELLARFRPHRKRPR